MAFACDVVMPHEPTDSEIKEVIKQFNLPPNQQEQVFRETKKNLNQMYKNQKCLLPQVEPVVETIDKEPPKNLENKGFQSKKFESKKFQSKNKTTK